METETGWQNYLAEVPDLAMVYRALAREKAIRETMIGIGESREVVVEAVDSKTLLDHPWPGVPELEVCWPTMGRVEIWIGSEFILAAELPHHTREGLLAIERTAQAVHREISKVVQG